MTDYLNMGSDSGLFGSVRQVCELQLVNWSVFRGYHSIPIAHGLDSPAVTTVTGESGIGKSALVDAYFEIIAKNPRFNSASNKGTRGSSIANDKRTLISYIRGKMANEETAEGLKMQRMHSPLDQPVWSAIAVTAVNDMGGHVTVGKAFWADAGCSDNDGLARVMFTADSEFNISRLESIAGERFKSSAFEKMGLTTYSSVTDYLSDVYCKLGISENGDPEKIVDLLLSAKEGAQFDSVEELFKNMVMSKPSSLAAAKDAVEFFESVESSWKDIRSIEEKRDLLKTLPDHVRSYREKMSQVQRLSDINQGSVEFARSELYRELAESICAAERGEGLLKRYSLEHERLVAEHERCKIARREAEQALYGNGGNQLDILEKAANSAEAHVRAVRSTRSELARVSAELFGDIPETAEDFDLWQSGARQCLEGKAAALDAAYKQLSESTTKEDALKRGQAELADQLRYMMENRGMVPAHLRRVRDALAAGLGIPAENAPFAAELMEIDDPRWSDAVEGALFDLARTILIDSSLSEKFGETAEGAYLPDRINVEFAQAQMPVGDGALEGVCSHVSVDTSSPFAGWLSMRLAADDARLAAASELSSVDRAAVTSGGQTRAGERASAGDLGARIIGIDNAAAVKEAEDKLDKIKENLEEANSNIVDSKNEIESINTAANVAEDIVSVRFSDIDLIGAKAAKERADAELAAFKREHDLSALKLQVEMCEKSVQAASEKADSAARALDHYKAILQDANDILGSPQRSSAVPPAAMSMLEERVEGAGSALEKWEALGKVDIADIVAKAQQGLVSARASANAYCQAAESTMREYRRHWGDGFEGATIECADYYLERQAELALEDVPGLGDKLIEKLYTHVNLKLAGVDAALDNDKRTINSTVAELNRVMQPLPFGPEHGTLQLKISWPGTSELSEWRRKTDALRKLAASPTETCDPMELMEATAEVMEDLRERLSDAHATPAQQAAHTIRRNRILNCCEHMTLDARDTYTDKSGEVHTAVIQSLGTSSGGECQEAMAFIQAIALLSALKCDTLSGTPHPSFGFVVLDEAFVKSSPAFTRRGIAAWVACGFQLFLAIPASNAQTTLEVSQQAYTILKNANSVSTFRPQALPEKRRACCGI